MTATLSRTEAQEQARAAYRASLTEGNPLTRDEVGELFGRSPSWGRDRIGEVRREMETIPGLVDPPNGDSSKEGVPPTQAEADDEDHVLERASTAPADHLVMSHSDGGQPPSTAARVVAWVGFAFGSVVSVAANWLAAWLPAADMPDGWSPTIATQVGAAVWPVALLLSVEVLSRTAWHSGWHWTVVRLGGSAVVASGSAIISYSHVRAVLLSWGYDIVGASVGPLVIDGLMVLSGFALLSMSRGRLRFQNIT